VVGHWDMDMLGIDASARTYYRRDSSARIYYREFYTLYYNVYNYPLLPHTTKIMTRILRLNILIALFLLANCTLAYPGSSTGSNWDGMIDGIRAFSADRKLKEEFVELCKTNETAIIDGRYDTGGGLYMEIDVPVYLKPAKSRITDLRNKDVVILVNESTLLDGTEWVKIKFLFISGHSGAAVAIEDGWIEKKHLKVAK